LLVKIGPDLRWKAFDKKYLFIKISYTSPAPTGFTFSWTEERLTLSQVLINNVRANSMVHYVSRAVGEEVVGTVQAAQRQQMAIARIKSC
jgi:hypothetical protein